MTDEQIQERVLTFLDARGGYVAGASERELFVMVKQAILADRERIVAALFEEYSARGVWAARVVRLLD